MTDLPDASTARTVVLHEGYAGRGVASTVGLVVDGDAVIVIDPGMVRSIEAILGPLADEGIHPEDVTDVVLSHHHPDHTMHAGRFGSARVHDHWAVYRGDIWDSRPAEGVHLAPSVRLIETPGHSPQDISTVVATPDGVWVFTHLWWTADGPGQDPRCTDQDAIHRGRERVLAIADVIVPGHGAPFTPDATTPR